MNKETLIICASHAAIALTDFAMAIGLAVGFRRSPAGERALAGFIGSSQGWVLSVLAAHRTLSYNRVSHGRWTS